LNNPPCALFACPPHTCVPKRFGVQAQTTCFGRRASRVFCGTALAMHLFLSRLPAAYVTSASLPQARRFFAGCVGEGLSAFFWAEGTGAMLST